MPFPRKFLFSAASSAYQIEGGWNRDGKGESIWDNLMHTNRVIKDNGDVACDSYHLFREDIELLHGATFDIYRFSISWSRILPNGEITHPNRPGILYYRNFIDELLQNGIEPMVTIYHWDLPQKLQDLGGWTNPLMVYYIEDYADLLFQLFGEKVKWWITINEPDKIVKGYETKEFAPALDLDSPANYVVAETLLRAHAKIYRLYDRRYREKQKGKISIILNSHFYKGKTDSTDDTDAANRAMQFHLGLYAHPIYSKEGDYPKIVRERVDQASRKEGRHRSRLPTLTEEDKIELRGAGAFDFFALNHCTTQLCTSGFEPGGKTFLKDMNVVFSSDPSWPSSTAPWLKDVPWGLRELLKFIKTNYDNPPVFITENGYGDNGELDDRGRLQFYKGHLQEVLNAMDTYKCNVIGYTPCSLLDKLEWLGGYGIRFGLVHVNFNDPKRKRTSKASYSFFKKLIESKAIPAIEQYYTTH